MIDIKAKDLFGLDDEGYEKYIEDLMFAFENASSKDNAALAGTLLEDALSKLIKDETKNDKAEIMTAYIELCVVKGFIFAHSKQENPSGLVVCGHILGFIDDFVGNVNKMIKEEDDERV